MVSSRINALLMPLHQVTHHPKAVFKGFLVAGVLASCATVAVILPGFINAKQKTDSVSQQINQMHDALEKLKTEEKEQNKKLTEMKAMVGEAAVIATNKTAGEQERIAKTENEIAYWRKQMEVFGAMVGAQIRIVGRSQSPYTDAVAIKVSISPKKDVSAISAKQTALVLDFLQAYGYVDSFDGKEALVHVQMNTHERSQP